MPSPTNGVPPWGFGLRDLAGNAPPLASVAENGTPPAQVSRQLAAYYPEQYPIPDARIFAVEGDATTAVAQNNVQIPLNAQAVIPPNVMGIVKSLTFQIDNMLITTNVVFTLLYNLVPVQGYNNIKLFPRAAPYVGLEYDTPFRFVGPGTFTCTFSNLDGGTYTVGVNFDGFYWPVTSDGRWKMTGQ